MEGKSENKFLNKNFFLRVISSVVLTSVMAFCLLKNTFTFSLLILLISIVSYFEWFSIVSNKLADQDPNRYTKYLMFWGILGLIAILPSSAAFLCLRYINGIHSIIYLVLTVAATDVGAYFFGRLIGGPKLAPSISPGKTLSGAIFGILSAMGVASILFVFKYFSEILYLHLMIITVIISVSSQIGDLMESAFKRHFGVKDSSNLIPGHGGFLDRIDGFLISAPIFLIMYFLDLVR